MMKGPSSRDSLSGCNPSAYSNPYEIRNHRNFKPVPPVVKPISKDTIEISREKLQKDALNRLRHVSKLVILQHSFMRIGKYLFLAIAMPPFVLLYEIPKWSFVVLIPAMMNLTTILWKKVHKGIDKQTKLVTHILNMMVLKIKQAAHKLIQPIINVALEIGHILQRFKEPMMALLWPLKEKLVKAKDRALGTLNKLRNKGAKALEAMTHPVKILQSGIEVLKSIPLFVYQKAVQFFKSRESVKKFSLGLGTSQRIAQGSMKWIEGKMASCKQGFESLSTGFKEVFKSVFNPIANFMKKAILERWVPVQNNVKTRYERFRRFIKSGISKYEALKQRRFLPSYSFNSMPSFIRSKLQEWVKNEKVRIVIQTTTKLFFSFMYYLLRGIDLLLALVQKMIVKMLSCVFPLMRLLNNCFHKGFTFLFKFMAVFGKVCRQLFYHFLVCGMMLGFILLGALQLLAETTGLVFSMQKKSA